MIGHAIGKNKEKLWRPRQSELPRIEEGTLAFVESKDSLRRWPSHWATPKDGRNLGYAFFSAEKSFLDLRDKIFD